MRYILQCDDLASLRETWGQVKTGKTHTKPRTMGTKRRVCWIELYIYIYKYVFFASGISSTVLASRLIHVFWIGFLKINIFYLLCGLFVGDIVCRLSSASNDYDIITKHNQEIRVFDSMFGLPQIEQLPMSNQLWGSLCLAMQVSCSS